ncbi:MAG: hypothetical protein HYR88_11960 [Verrucomicrobia bacterium]|nr:hypothetical protein [Verrucomicrobiota bacterium]
MRPRSHVLLTVIASVLFQGAAAGAISSIDPLFQPWLPSGEPFGDITARHRVLQWKVEQGLPQNHITALYQTTDGYLWAGTVFGLTRYDGARFTVFDKSTLPLMQETDDHVLGIAEDSEHTLWVCTKTGLLRYGDHTWRAYATGGPVLKEGQPTGVARSAKGGVWVGVQGLLLRFDSSGLREQYTPPFPKVRSIRMVLEDRLGRVWMADRYRMMRWDPSTGESKLIHDAKGGWVRFIREDADRRICFGGEFGGYRVMEDDKPQMIAGLAIVDGSRQTNVVYDAVFDGGNKLWIAENGRLVRTEEQPTPSTPGRRLGHHDHPGLRSVSVLLRDAEANLWAGSDYDGLAFVQERRFSTLQVSTNWSDNNIWAVCEDAQGAVWIGTSHDLFRWHENRMTRFLNPREAKHSGQIFSLFPTPGGPLYVGYAGLGVLRLNEDRWERVYPVKGPETVAKELNVRSVCRDSQGVLWFGMLDGLHRLTGAEHSLISTNEGLPGTDVRVILEHRDGALWVGTYAAGLARIKNGEIRSFGKQDGLPDNQVQCLQQDPDGALWIGTGSGLARYKNGVFGSITRKQGLLDHVVNGILRDDEDNFWISCNRGIYRASRQGLNRVLEGSQSVIVATPFGEADGMLSAETNGGGQPSAWKGRDGTLWFPTTKGLLRIDPRRVRNNQGTPDVVIEQVLANNQVRFGDGVKRGIVDIGEAASAGTDEPDRSRWGPLPLSFGAGEARVVEIRYTAASFEDPLKVRFQYRLAGHDRDWQDAGDRRVTHYTNLSPGRYEFWIRACNNHGVWGAVNRGLTFSVAPFFYQTWWFFALCGCLVFGVASGVQAVRLNIQRRILQLEKRHALERERARIAKDMHDDLGARLTQLGLVSELAESVELSDASLRRQSLPKVSTLAREAVRSLDEIVWAVSPKKNSLDQLAGYLAQSAQDLIAPSGARFDLQMPSNIPAIPLSTETRHNVFLACKEAVNNAVKHSRAQRIGLQLSFDEHAALARVTDDGRGFIQSEAEGLGNGLANMRKRAESVGATLTLRSRANEGTEVEILVPFSKDSSV